MKSYKEYAEKYIDRYVKITVPSDKIIKIKDFVNKVVNRKVLEEHHKEDNLSEYKRFYTGVLGEAALEEYLGINIIDWTVGDSKKYHRADLRNIGLNVGIKTVEYGKFPVIFKKEYYPEIINIKISDTEVLICGVATVDILTRYQDDDLIIDQNLKRRGTKTGFYGFKYLKKFDSLDELKNIVK